MSRRDPYEACSRCETFHLSSEMTSVPVRDANGQIVQLRLCPSCMRPYTTYIQAAWIQQVNLERSVTVAAIMTAALVVLMVLFGAILGSPYGGALMLAGILTGACVLASLAVGSCIRSH